VSTPADPQPLRWISEARFHRDHLPWGLDHDYGMTWGEHRQQRVCHRVTPGSDRGLLYAYDPLWNEYAVLAESVSSAVAGAAFETVTDRHGTDAIGLSLFTAALTEAMQIDPWHVDDLDAPLALSVNETATYMRHNPPPAPLPREIEL
jgi:hypothetical protein